MGIRLSDNGGLTFSQQKGLTKAGQERLLEKLSRHPMNQKLLADLEKQREDRKNRTAAMLTEKSEPVKQISKRK